MFIQNQQGQTDEEGWDAWSWQQYQSLSDDEKRVFGKYWRSLYGGGPASAAMVNFQSTKGEKVPGLGGKTYLEHWDSELKNVVIPPPRQSQPTFDSLKLINDLLSGKYQARMAYGRDYSTYEAVPEDEE